ncbi:MAG TPA: DUF1861 family protein [Clostridia bacterium]|jgi:hypothetical protein|nr:DUF1861 family protein [Clostridia bacterium]HPY43371.1 DUF1861 family protein [Clostridia bacterium]HQA96944.1 DUF1861 family protein [Clostridia bacterium]HQO56185.1 DUF1861 family protein [Clostridia bacterium]HUM61232.1 DUF1861 family protein [Clostridia bacterium]
MTFKQRKDAFEQRNKKHESSLLSFIGVEGFDVYNCSIPFEWKGQTYIYGRVEKRQEWARSRVRLFRRVEKDRYSLVPQSMIYQLEDPFISLIGGQLVLGGTHVVKSAGNIDFLYGYFYRGTELEDLHYFTTGPKNMKDIRLVDMGDGRVGVFSRPRGKAVLEAHGSESVVGFAIVPSLDDLTADIVEDAPVIENMFAANEWGGCNQCYLLDSGLIGIIGHKSYPEKTNEGLVLAVYTNISFVFDPKSHSIVDEKIIATRASFPGYTPKKPELVDCAFASGIWFRQDGRADLYSGVGDTAQGRVVVDNPFKGFGEPVFGNIRS